MKPQKIIIAVICGILTSFITCISISAMSFARSETPVLTVKNIDSTTNRLTWTKINGAKSYVIYLLNEDTNKFERSSGEMKKMPALTKICCRILNIPIR